MLYWHSNWWEWSWSVAVTRGFCLVRSLLLFFLPIASGGRSGRERKGSGCAFATRNHSVPPWGSCHEHLAWGENLVETGLLCEQVWAGYSEGCGEKPTFTSHHMLLQLLLHLHWLCHFTSHTGKLKKTFVYSLSEKKPLWLWEKTCVP